MGKHNIRYGAGDAIPKDKKAAVETALEAAYDEDSFGMIDISLHYTAGRGFRITEALLHSPGIAAVGEGGRLPAAEIKDCTGDVRAVLEAAGVEMF